MNGNGLGIGEIAGEFETPFFWPAEKEPSPLKSVGNSQLKTQSVETSSLYLLYTRYGGVN